MSETDISTSLRRLVEESKERKLSIEERHKELSGSSNDSKQRLHQLQLQYSDLKQSFRYEKFKFYMFDAYKTDLPAEKGDEDCPTNEKLSSVVETLTGFKERLQASRESIDESADELDVLHAEFGDCLNDLEAGLNDYEAKRKKLCEMYAISTELLENGLVDQTDHLKEKADTLRATQYNVSETLRLTQENVNELHGLMQEGKQTHEKIQQQMAKGVQRVIEWCSGCTDVIKTLHGVQDQGIDHSGWTLTISHLTPDNDSDLSLKVKLSIDWGTMDKPRLTSVKLDSGDFDASSIITKAVATNDVPFLLTSLRECWLSHYPLLNELQHLRQKYAVDWQQENRFLHLMLGKNSNIICILKVDHGYPSNGAVALETVKNVPDLEVSSLKPPDCNNPSIAAWLDYLHDTLGHSADRQPIASTTCI